MSGTERSKNEDKSNLTPKELSPGVRGRTIEPDDLKINEDLVRKLAEESGSDALTNYLFRIFNIKSIKEPKKKK